MDLSIYKEHLNIEYSMDEMCNLIDRSPRSVRRLIEKGYVEKVKRDNQWLYRLINPEEESEIFVIKKNYYYDEEKDEYFIPVIKGQGTLRVTGQIVRSIIRMYSNDGGGLTFNAINKEYTNLTLDQIKSIIIALEKTHDDNPYTDEEVSTVTEEELEEELYQIKQKQLVERVNKRIENRIVRDASMFSTIRKSLLDYVVDNYDSSVPSLYKPLEIKTDPSVGKYAVVLSPTDLHIGKLGFKDLEGNENSFEKTREMLINETKSRLSDVLRYGKPERIYVTIGSDMIHIDNFYGTTTKGTKVNYYGNHKDLTIQACYLMQEFCNMCLAVADSIDIVFMPGNHDETTSLTVFANLMGYYNSHPESERVQWSHELLDRQYCQYGNNLLGFYHGQTISKEKLQPLMAYEAREEWGKTEHHMWFTGHLHHEVSSDKNGVMYYQMPCLSATDEWSYRRGFIMSRKTLPAYLIHYTDGKFATIDPVLKGD